MWLTAQEVADSEQVLDLWMEFGKFPKFQSRNLWFSINAALACIVLSPPALADSDFSPVFEWGGRLELDAATFDSDDPRFVDDAIVRRALASFRGNLTEKLSFKIEYNARNDKLRPRAYWVRWDLPETWRLTVGQMKQPLGLQAATSSRYNTFMERALPRAFGSGYRVGAMFNAHLNRRQHDRVRSV